MKGGLRLRCTPLDRLAPEDAPPAPAPSGPCPDNGSSGHPDAALNGAHSAALDGGAAEAKQEAAASAAGGGHAAAADHDASSEPWRQAGKGRRAAWGFM